MPCHPQANMVFSFSQAAQPRAAQAKQTPGRSLQHLQVPCHLPDQGRSPPEGGATSAPTEPHSRANKQHGLSCSCLALPSPPRGLSQLLLAFTEPARKETCAQSRTSLKPALLVQPVGTTAPWSSAHRDSPAPAPSSHRGSQVHKNRPYMHHRARPSTHLVQMAGKDS